MKDDEVTVGSETKASTGSDTIDIEGSEFRGPWQIEIVGRGDGWIALLNQGDRLILGHGKKADLRLDDPAVSRVHAEISASRVGVVVTDLDSKNGVYFGSGRVKHALLGSGGGAFMLGRTTISVRPSEALGAATHAGGPIAGLVGTSLAMQRVRAEIRRFAKISASVLIQGESGTGKDVVARALHRLSGREGEYVPLNLGGLSSNLADAELFGYRRGAFTGAVASRVGAFEQANHGTLFLDEVGDVAPEVQVKLLRVLEDRRVQPLGASTSKAVDVRVIGASWVPLLTGVEQGRFREDLYHRLATVTLALPPLRQRKSDIPELAGHLLRGLEPEVGGMRELMPAALGALVNHDWPGNVRELRAVLLRAALNDEHGCITEQSVLSALPPRKAKEPITKADVLRHLRRHQWNLSAAARGAHMARSTFRDWARRYGVERASLADDSVSDSFA